MVPRITSKGRSFLGAGAYFLHDLGSTDTAERVSFVQTVNMLTDDPAKALRVMAWTAGHAEELKAISGQKRTGRKARDPVYNYCLAWAPDQNPSRDEMISFGMRSMEALGVEDHEALFVAHDDTEHKHLHVILNRVHPVTGLMAKMSHDRNLLSRLSQSYEEETGWVYCQERVNNNRRRDHGEASVTARDVTRLMETPAYRERRAARVAAQRDAVALAAERKRAQQTEAARDLKGQFADAGEPKPASDVVATEREEARRAWLNEQRAAAWETYEASQWQHLNDRHTMRRENLNERLKSAATRNDVRLERKYADTEKYARRRVERLEERIAVDGIRHAVDRLTGRQAQLLEHLDAARAGWIELQRQKAAEREVLARKQQGQREAEQVRHRVDRERLAERLQLQKRQREAAFEVRERERQRQRQRQSNTQQSRSREALDIQGLNLNDVSVGGIRENGRYQEWGAELSR